jgi:hypothetical protein
MKAIAKFMLGAEDRKRYVVDYNDWLDEAELLNYVFMSGDVPADDFYVDGFVRSDDDKEIIFYVSGGVVGKSYNVKLNVGTTLSQTKVDYITFVVT